MDKEKKEVAPKASRGLKNRHIQIIAIAGTIGTGLFMGAGSSIHKTGPSILFIYLAIGAIMFILLRTIGEMLFQDSTQHSFLTAVGRYLGPKTGYFAQWTYWLVVVFMAMAELTAIGTYLQFWLPSIPLWVTEPLILILLTLLNTLNAKFFGETEFWFGMIKIIAIIGMILTALILILTSFKANGDTVSLSNITTGFAFFPNGIGNFIGSFQMVMFAFVAMEFIGMTAAETEDPKKTLPKAINQIPIRILIFYIGALVAIMAIYNWRNIPANQSPFVMIFELIGIKWAASLINFVVLTSAASALNSALFSTTRNLFSLSNATGGRITRPFTKMSRFGIPLNALLFSALLILITPFVSLIPSLSNAFVAITSIATNLFLIIYILTLFAYLRYRKSKDYLSDGFKTPFPQLFVPLAILAFAFIFVSLFFFADTLYPAIGALVWIVIFGFIAFFRKSQPIN